MSSEVRANRVPQGWWLAVPNTDRQSEMRERFLALGKEEVTGTLGSCFLPTHSQMFSAQAKATMKAGEVEEVEIALGMHTEHAFLKPHPIIAQEVTSRCTYLRPIFCMTEPETQRHLEHPNKYLGPFSHYSHVFAK